MNLPKTKALCTERIQFLEGALKSITDKKQKEDFQYEKYKWECCLNSINGENKSWVVTDKKTGRDLTFEHFGKDAINPYLNFQKLMREKLMDDYKRQQDIQNQSSEECVKMTKGEFLDYTNEYERILNNYNNDIHEAESCLTEIKKSVGKKEKI